MKLLSILRRFFRRSPAPQPPPEPPASYDSSLHHSDSASNGEIVRESPPDSGMLFSKGGAQHSPDASLDLHFSKGGAAYQDDDSGLRFSRGGASQPYGGEGRSIRQIEDIPVFADVEKLAVSRPFAKRVMQGVRDVYGGDPVPFYQAAELSRSAYSRIISHPEYHPSKDTVLSMAAAFHFSLQQAESFLRLAGYALSTSIPSDIVWRYCFEHGIHDLPRIRALLARLP